MTVWAGPDTPTPHLSCLVGFTSIEITQLWRISCSNATNHRLGIAKIDRKKLKWPKEKSEIVSVFFSVHHCIKKILIQFWVSA